ncbi:hypothetical protein VCHC52A1_3400, partial [Vibrio cholerae HC-52A1]
MSNTAGKDTGNVTFHSKR